MELILVEGRSLTIYLSEEDLRQDLTPAHLEGSEHRLFDAAGRRLEIADDEVRVTGEAPDELADALRSWLLWAGADWIAERPHTLPELLDVALDWLGAWHREPSADVPVARGFAAALLAVVAVVFAAAIAMAVAATREAGLQVVQGGAGAAAVALLLVAAVRLWRRRTWWPWVAGHVVCMAVATAAALLSS